MIARIAARGHSFKGAGLYYLHDKAASTTDRVVWTQVRNLPMENPEAATNYMAYTAISANRIKQEAGVPLTGRKREKGVVYTFSLSWSPEEKPNQEIMIKSADETLEVLGLQDHQSLIVAHNDTKHPHVHVICNLVNPNDGRMHDPDWGSKLKMSDWSLKHEFENGKIYCEQRVENNKKRKQGKLVKYQEPLHDRKAEIQELYRQSDSGKAFSAALEEKGYTIAKGNRRSFVLVDYEGRVHSLSRQLDKDQKKEYVDKLSDLSRKDLPLAKEVQADRQYFDRDKQEMEQLQRIEDAAIEKAKKEQEAEKQEKLQAKKKKQQVSGREIKSKVTKIPKKQYSANDNRKHLRQLDKEQEWDKVATEKRVSLEAALKNKYNRAAHLERIKAFQRELKANDNKWGKLTGYFNTLSKELEREKLTLANIDMRIAEAWEKLENELNKTNPRKNKGGQSKNLSNEFEKNRHKKAKTEREQKTAKYMRMADDYRKRYGHDLDR